MAFQAHQGGWTGIRNGPEIADFTVALADRVAYTLDSGRWPLILGGDCSVLVGAMLALRRRGHYGLLFVDGHLDFRHPGNAAEHSAVAGEDLAVVTGRGLPEHADIDGLRPYVHDADVVALGDREGDPDTADILETAITVIDLAELRGLGSVSSTIKRALGVFRAQRVDGFRIHVDVDVLDSELMPAVDSPAPDGLTFEELEETVALASPSPLAVGADVTIFDPELDEEGTLAHRLADLLVSALHARANPTRAGTSPELE